MKNNVNVNAMSVNGNSGIYAPLKQILTESDSDDERKEGTTKVIGSSDLDINSGLKHAKNISLSDMDDFNTNENTVESTMDNLSFLQSDTSNEMSLPRRFAFVASILACIFTVVVYLWGIPCSEINSCANNEWQDKTTSWELPYEDIELSGAMQVVDGVAPNTKNLIFIYRGNHMVHPDNEIVNGVLLIVGNSGKVGWYTREERIPTEINCHLIDVNRDKQKDCIVAGSQGLLAAINPISGTYYWYIHRHGNVFSDIVTIDFPILLKDMDKDKVYDLLTVATVQPNINHNSLLIISGATGNIIGEPMTIEDCLSVKLLTESDLVNITYLCKNGSSEAFRWTSYSALSRKLVKLDQTVVSHVSPITNATKKQKISLKKSIGNTREIFNNGPGKLVVENFGECPNNCQVKLKLWLGRNNSMNISWEYSANFVYAMRPSTFAFANSIRGFVLKL